MIATLWLFSLVSTIMLSSTECVYHINRDPVSNYQLTDSSIALENSILTEKRTKPSLSIVNPLDVLRQRLLLEIARRHMRENTKQVEINRAILKNVGKRINQFDYYGYHNSENGQKERASLQDDDDLQIKYLYSLQKDRYLNI